MNLEVASGKIRFISADLIVTFILMHLFRPGLYIEKLGRKHWFRKQNPGKCSVTRIWQSYVLDGLV